MNAVRQPSSVGSRAPGLRRALEALAGRHLTVSALIGQALDAAQASKRDVGAFAAIDRDGALSAAAESERRYAAGRQRPLEGLPIGVKDLIDTQGIDTSYGSAAYLGHRPSSDADILSALIEQGAIPIGKTRSHEFAWGVTTASATFGDTLNPLDRTRIPGGSSGGAAAAIAYGAVAAGLGTDTGGSVRIPAALCGVVGFKPTFGTLSTRGIFPLAPTLDHAGFLGQTVEDIMILAGAFSIEAPQGLAPASVRFGVVREIAPIPPSAEVAKAFDIALGRIAETFASTTLAAPGLFDGVFEGFAHIVLTEGGVEHFRRSDAERIAAHYGSETIDRLERAKTMTLGDYARAQQTRREFAARLHRAMAEVDYLLLPTCPCTAPRSGQASIDIGRWSGTVREALMTYTAPFNVAGFPAISIPLAAADGGLPTALQVVAKPGKDGPLLRIAQQIERLLGPDALTPPHTTGNTK
ncbi:amidase [Variovorax sp. J31P207]|uniref:amidase n=1 Tax=Variovorax sp. J31P207 TaxID=3053510 RepID=UPI002578269F|nr:amidase [Variovorax sp. J31P207]MDM0066729.1 amidase [Variovorax sp. J31P207]